VAVITELNKELQAALAGVVGGDIDKVARVVIDIRAGHAVVVHVERFADERLIDVVRALEGIQINTVERV
jgi:hypothetical protein